VFLTEMAVAVIPEIGGHSLRNIKLLGTGTISAIAHIH
jgi:hypothetical protein